MISCCRPLCSGEGVQKYILPDGRHQYLCQSHRDEEDYAEDRRRGKRQDEAWKAWIAGRKL